jgi:hypothetical protein
MSPQPRRYSTRSLVKAVRACAQLLQQPSFTTLDNEHFIIHAIIFKHTYNCCFQTKLPRMGSAGQFKASRTLQQTSLQIPALHKTTSVVFPKECQMRFAENASRSNTLPIFWATDHTIRLFLDLNGYL